MRFLVRVSCYGSRWLVDVPAFGIRAVVNDKREIEDTARSLIKLCGAAPAEFDIDLELGRFVEPAEQSCTGGRSFTPSEQDAWIRSL